MSASRLVTALAAIAILSAAAPAFAQSPPPPDYEKELGALVGISGGLTADEAAARAAKVSPDARRKQAELASARAQVDQAKLARIPRVDATLRYTRLSNVTLPAALAPFIKILNNNYNADAQVSV